MKSLYVLYIVAYQCQGPSLLKEYILSGTPDRQILTSKILSQCVQELLGAFLFQKENCGFNDYGGGDGGVEYPLFVLGWDRKSVSQEQHLSSLGKPRDAKW